MLFTVLVAFFAFACAQTQLSNGAELTFQVEGSFSYYVDDEAQLPGRIVVNIYNISAGAVRACLNGCSEDDANNGCPFSSESCFSGSMCSLEIDVCEYAQSTYYYLSIVTTTSAATFSVRLQDLTVSVPPLGTVATTYAATTAQYRSSLFKFEVTDNSQVHYVKATRRDGGSGSSRNPTGSIYLPGDDLAGQYRTCGGYGQSAFSTFSSSDFFNVLSILTPSCGFVNGWYTVVLQNSDWDVSDWDLVVNTYDAEASEIQLGLSSHIVTATQRHPFDLFYYDQEDNYETDLTFSTTDPDDSAIVYYFNEPVDTDSKREYPFPGYYGGQCDDQVSRFVTGSSFSENNDFDITITGCSPLQGRIFFSVFPLDGLPFVYSIDRRINTQSVTDVSTTEIGVLTNLDHSSGSNKRTHYWKINDPNGLIGTASYYRVNFDNTNSSADARLYLSRDGPGENSLCMSGNSFGCDRGARCYFGIEICKVPGDGDLFLTIHYESAQNQNNVNAPFAVDLVQPLQIQINSGTSYWLAGSQIRPYYYFRSDSLFDLITVDRESGNLFTRRMDNSDDGWCSSSSSPCLSGYPCQIPIFCYNNGIENRLTITGNSETIERANYSIGAASYDDGSFWVTKLSSGVANTLFYQGPRTHYYYFKTDGHEAFTVTVTKTTSSDATYSLYRNDNCDATTYFHNTPSTSYEISQSNIPALDSDGKYWFVINQDAGDNNTYTVIFREHSDASLCRDVSGDISFCTNYIDGTLRYSLSSTQATINDDIANSTYRSYVFHSASSECMDDVRDFICDELFKPCNDDGTSSALCEKTCNDALSNCPTEDYCLWSNCYDTLSTICVLEYPSSSSSLFISASLLAVVTLMQLF